MLRRLFESSILRYVGVGGSAFIFDFMVTVGARDLLRLPLWLAVAAGFWGGFLVNFSLQRNFTFRSRAGYTRGLVGYFSLVGFNWIATTALMEVFVTGLGWPTWLGKILCTGLTVVWNYPAYRYLIFPPGKPPVPEPAEPPGQVEFVIPAHNSADLLPGTIAEIQAWSVARGLPVSVLLVENGSHDATAEVARQLADEHRDAACRVTALTSEPGMGCAYRAGIAASSGGFLVLSADDLPFGTSDIDRWLAAPVTGLAIGSKAHPDSDVPRTLARRVASLGFRMMRRALLDSRVGDAQGTLLLSGDVARDLAPHLRETGYLSSTEIVAHCEARRIPVTELPVTLRAGHAEHGTRIRIRDVWRMALGLLAMRSRARDSVSGHHG